MRHIIIRLATATAIAASFALSGAATLAPLVRADGGPDLSTSTMSVQPTGTVNPDSSLSYQVTITNSGHQPATNVTYTDTPDGNETLGGSFTSTPIARDDFYNAIGNVGITVPSADGLLANDSAPDGASLSVTQHTYSGGGSLTVNSDGSFTYTPAAGFSGDDSFTYTLSSSTGGTDTATATIDVSAPIWFVNNNSGACSTSCNGRLSNPFTSLSSFQDLNNGSGNNPGSNQAIFLYSSSNSYTGGLTLLSGQTLIGQGAASPITTLLNITLPTDSNPLPATGQTAPTISNSSSGVTLGSNNGIYGLNISNSGGVALSGSSFGTFTAKNVDITNTSGTALSLNTGTLDVILPVLSAGNASAGTSAVGVSIANTSGALEAQGGTIQNLTGTTTNGVRLDNAAGITLDGMTIETIGQYGVYVSSENGSLSQLSLNSGSFDNVRSSAVESIASNASTTDVSVTNSTFTSSNPEDGSDSYNDNVALTNGNTSSTNYTITGNTFSHIGLSDIIANLGDGTNPETMQGTIENNTIGLKDGGGKGIEYSGSVEGEGIWVDGNGNTTNGGGTSNSLVKNNTIYGTHDNGILVGNGDGAPAMNATVTGNVVDIASDPDSYASIYVFNGKTGGDTDTLCAQVTGNTVTTAGVFSTDLVQGANSDPDTFTLSGLTGGTSDSAVTTYLDGHNTEPAGASGASGNFLAGASQCTQPPTPPKIPTPSVVNRMGRVNATPQHAISRATVHHRVRHADGVITAGTPITIGTLPASHSVTLTFPATVNSEIDNPSGNTTITNDGAIDASDIPAKDVSASNPLALFDSGVVVQSGDSGTGTYGDNVEFTATVSAASGSGTPTGTVAFFDGDPNSGGTQIGSLQTLVSGTASVSTTGLGGGSHTVFAVYSGDDRFNGNSGSVGQQMNLAASNTSLKLTSGSNPSKQGASLTFQATVSSSSTVPTGTVTFYDGDPNSGGTQIGADQTLVAGVSSVTTSSLGIGSHTIYAVYGGDTNFEGSQNTLSQQVNTAIAASTTAVKLTTGANPSTYGDALTFSASVTSSADKTDVPSGKVEFWDGNPQNVGSAKLGSGTLGASAKTTFTTSSLAGGKHDIYAVYAGDSNFEGSQSDITQQVKSAATSASVSLSSGKNPDTYGSSLTFTAAVRASRLNAAAPTGTVKFYLGDPQNSHLLGTGTLADHSSNTASASTASATTTGVLPGLRTIFAVYDGDQNYGGSQDDTTQGVIGGRLVFRMNRGNFSSPTLSPPGANGLAVTVKFNTASSCVQGLVSPVFHARWITNGMPSGTPQLAPCAGSKNVPTDEMLFTWNSSGKMQSGKWEHDGTVLKTIPQRQSTTNGVRVHLCQQVIALCFSGKQNSFAQIQWTENGQPLQAVTPPAGANRLLLKVLPQPLDTLLNY